MPCPCAFEPTPRALRAIWQEALSKLLRACWDTSTLAAMRCCAATQPGSASAEQQQRAAARALMGAPEIVLADEPTSSLSIRIAGQSFLELLFRECARERTTLIFVTHDEIACSALIARVEFGELNRGAGESRDYGEPAGGRGDSPIGDQRAFAIAGLLPR